MTSRFEAGVPIVGVVRVIFMVEKSSIKEEGCKKRLVVTRVCEFEELGMSIEGLGEEEESLVKVSY